MCRKVIVTNRLMLGNRCLGWEAYSLPKGEVLEFTEKQLKDAIRSGADEVYGLVVSEDTGELEFDREGFFTTNMMNKSHINSLVPMDTADCMVNLFYTVIGSHGEGDARTYDAVSSRYERVVLTAEKAKVMLEMGVISGGAKLEDGKIVAASMERKLQASGTATETEAAVTETKKGKGRTKGEAG